MAIQNASINKEMNLVLSSDAKPRLKWTSELHQRFIDAVNRLGGAEKATPKSLMRVMGVHGLTLYHLKSHLQKYRLGRSQPSSQTNHKNKQGIIHLTSKIPDGATEQINENSQIAQALQMQMEVQRKLHEQIEVQRHLQLRIEAQGKYLHSVLRKAQETLSGYGSCSIEVEQAKSQLSELVSMVDSGCPSSSFSVLTESEGSMLKDARNKLFGHNGCSFESSLTSSESSGQREETPPKHEDETNYTIDNGNKGKRNSVLTSLIDETQSTNKKRINIAIDKVNQSVNEKTGAQSDQEQVQRLNLMKNIDLNCEFDMDPEVIDLNCKGC